MKTDIKTLNEIMRLYSEYVKECENCGMTPLTVDTYKINTYNFIRWIRDEFQPGSRIKK